MGVIPNDEKRGSRLLQRAGKRKKGVEPSGKPHLSASRVKKEREEKIYLLRTEIGERKKKKKNLSTWPSESITGSWVCSWEGRGREGNRLLNLSFRSPVGKKTGKGD